VRKDTDAGRFLESRGAESKCRPSADVKQRKSHKSHRCYWRRLGLPWMCCIAAGNSSPRCHNMPIKDPLLVLSPSSYNFSRGSVSIFPRGADESAFGGYRAFRPSKHLCDSTKSLPLSVEIEKAAKGRERRRGRRPRRGIKSSEEPFRWQSFLRARGNIHGGIHGESIQRICF